jgi:hypothetical protein
MIHIQHRRNTIDQLKHTSKEYGVEIDIRNHGDALLVVHDPFSTDAIDLSEWLIHYNHKFLIVNVKEEGLEPKLLSLLKQFKVYDFFILDETIPFIRKYAMKGISNFALRVSEFESIETALKLNAHLKNKGHCIDWIWLDSFTGAPIDVKSLIRLRTEGFKLCQVSPELHHVDDPKSWEVRIAAFHAACGESYRPDMVCTKRPDLW